MSKIIEIIKKNLTLLARARNSAIIVILAPLIIILLVGLAFDNSNVYQVNIGAYSEGYNALTESFITKLSQNHFNIAKSSNEKECIDKVKDGSNQACIVFPKDMSISDANTNGTGRQIVFYIDYSRINLVWAIRDLIVENVQQRSEELSTDMTSVLLQKLKDAQDEIRNQKPTVLGFSDDNIAISREADNIKSNLDQLQLSIDKKEFKTAEINAEADSLKHAASGIIGHSKESLESLREAANNITDASQRMQLLEEINSTSEWLNSQNQSLENEDMNLSRMLGLLNATVESTSGMANGADDARKQIYSRITTIKQRTASSLKNIAAIQSSLNKIDTSVEAIAVKDSKTIVSPVTTVMKPVIGERSKINYIFPGIIIMIIMLVSIILGATIVMNEKKSRAYFRNFITPTNDLIFFFGTAISALLIMLLQLIVIIAITMIFFSSQIIAGFLPMIIILVLVTSLFVFLGMAIGYMFNSEITATLAAVSLSALLLLLSGMIFPLEGISSSMIDIVKMNPFILCESLLRRAVLLQNTLTSLGGDILILLIYAVVIMIIAIVAQQSSKRNISKYMKTLVRGYNDAADANIDEKRRDEQDAKENEDKARKFLRLKQNNGTRAQRQRKKQANKTSLHK